MAQFRLKATSAQGKMIKTEFEADSKKDAEKKVEKISRKNGLKVHSIDKKETYVYKVKKGAKNEVKGEQEAYSKEELEKALVKLGYKVISINKKWFDWKGGVPNKEVVTFIRLSADLLKQQLSFDEILTLLYEDTQNKRMKEVIKQIQKDLKDGKEGSEVYGKHEDVFGKFAAYMLSVASTSGNMAEVFESTAKFMERDAEFKKNLRRSLMMPTITVIAVIGVVLFYVGYIFPEMAGVFVDMDINLEQQAPMTAATLDWSAWLQTNWLYLTLGTILPIVGFIYYIKTPKGKLMLDKHIHKLPVMGDLMHKTSIEIFSRVFYTLYSGSGQNIEVIKVAAEACRNKYMEKQIKEVAIKMMLKEGAGLIESLKATGVFTNTAISRFKLGAESGALRENAQQLAEYYEIQTTYKMESVIDLISLFVNLFICIALVAITVVSSESALIKPQSGM
ncbi:type II secretion system F family protein [Aliifodinibius sp. S!AR15-10]|uniref:type II secretion system F family protein n=1 Tax=Aliifodinibius sp. S!AR15-10 TaxID=2950437 RepID=UPI0028579B32|nr:type II secretion system F family protein [Aliifodinibius sp. S!AR15-10]MDR8391609.1 type II secretion system F family protein [Aliifodinibius sp. S!AR15-10]